MQTSPIEARIIRDLFTPEPTERLIILTFYKYRNLVSHDKYFEILDKYHIGVSNNLRHYGIWSRDITSLFP